MTDLQQSIFLNLSRVTKYQNKSRVLSSPYAFFSRDRSQQIANEFELVDFQGKGSITRQEMLEHLKNKYRDLDMGLLDNLLKDLRWDYRKNITKDQFCRIFLAREKQLFREMHQLLSLKTRMDTTRQIFNETLTYNPPLYALININKVYIRSNRPQVASEDMLTLEVEYQDHKNKLDYMIEQPVYSVDEPSFELLLPVQEEYFFVKYKFINPRSKSRETFGQCYVNYPINEVIRQSDRGGDGFKRANTIRCDITKNKEVKGFCQFTIVFQNDMDKIDERIQDSEEKIYNAHEKADQCQREYEYLQYIWGIRHKSPHKIGQEDVKWMIIFRLVVATLLGLLSVVVQCLGRCEPLSFLLALLIFKNWKYVIIQDQKFLMTWLTIVAICLDVAWLSFVAFKISLINFMNLPAADILTYMLIVVKAVFMLYMLIVEKSFSGIGSSSGGEEKK